MSRWRVIAIGRRLARRTGVGLLGLAAAVKLGGPLAATMSLLVSLAVYAAAFGLQFAVGLMILLLAHEWGHILASRIVGLKTAGPMFIPFVGAVISLRQKPANVKMNANVAIGGPAAGTLSALICLVIFLWTDDMLMLALCYTACLLNLFNLIPCPPLDGERIAAAISPRLWWLGSGILALAGWYANNLLILAVFLFSLVKLWKNPDDRGYRQIAPIQRLRMAAWYFGLAAVLGGVTWYAALLLQ